MPEEFAAKYGALQTEVDNVAEYLRPHGMTVSETSLSRRRVVASGSVENMDRAFGVELARYRTVKETYRGREGQVHVHRDVAALVEGVFGLDNRRVSGRDRAPNAGPRVPKWKSWLMNRKKFSWHMEE